MKIDPHWRSLSTEEARRLAAQGKANIPPKNASKSVWQIWLSNLFTFYNMLNIVLAVLVATTGSYRNMLFLGIVICNFFIGTIQELRAKRTLDKLSVLTAPTARVIRDGAETVLPCRELVLGDVIILGAGDQVTADGTVLGGEASVNESLLTGESDPMPKSAGSRLFSGSFIVSGECAAVLTAVGADSYAEKLTEQARRRPTEKSVLKNTMIKIIKGVSAFIVPMGIITFVNHYFVHHAGYADSMISTVASMVGMIPDGLYLLTSMSFAVGAVRLAQRRTLTQQLYSLESLARADVLCLDKTGTITTGRMKVKSAVSLSGDNIGAIAAEIYAHVPADNATAKAITEAYGAFSSREAVCVLPFSSAYKYTAVSFGDEAYMLGAPEFVLGDAFPSELARAEEYSADGTRVLVLCSAKQDGKLYKADKPLGFILIEDEIRPGAAETFEYFRKNDVEIKVISGDNPAAVAAIAKKAGISGAESYVDASRLSDEELAAAAPHTAVFGRVSPEQKRVLVHALQAAGHTVGMTGDGVNDVLALKDADCSVAMASGAQAACHAAQLVLLDSDFSVMPDVVLEGRRVINNIQRAASLFLMKTMYSSALAALLLFVPLQYPFAPIHLTLIGAVASGIPGVVLALEPNFRRVSKDFMSSVLKRAAAGAITIFCGVVFAMAFGKYLGITEDEISTVSVIFTGISSLVTLLCSCLPLSLLKGCLVAACTAIFAVGVLIFDKLFMLVPLGTAALIMLLAMLPFTVIQYFIRSDSLRKNKV